MSVMMPSGIRNKGPPSRCYRFVQLRTVIIQVVIHVATHNNHRLFIELNSQYIVEIPAL
jgi:hypothetical protein